VTAPIARRRASISSWPMEPPHVGSRTGTITGVSIEGKKDMKAFQIAVGHGLSSLIVDDRSPQPLAPHEIRVRMEAAALNYRELQILDGKYGLPDGMIVTPGSDGAGIVVEVGALVTRFKNGERVLPAFWPDWIDGPITPAKTSTSFGADVRGTLAAELVAGEHAFVSAPTTLSAVEAACLPCAGVTAWKPCSWQAACDRARRCSSWAPEACPCGHYSSHERRACTRS
jgi:NADPH:quinone reductase-like Zn-dependent oxidoreductase